MDADDLELFERSLRAATEAHTGAVLDGALVDLGWSDAMADDPRAALSLLFELQGRANATSGALDLVLAHGAGIDLGPEAAGVVLPTIGTWDPPAAVAGGDLVVDGILTASAAAAPSATVVAGDGGELVTVVVATDALTRTTIDGLDPGLGLVRVAGTIAGTTGSPLPVERWTAAVALARIALAHELVGVSRRMLELAREHALERVQFGVPISSFQAIRHRLAETLVAIEMAEAVIDAAWIDGTPGTASMAKAVAGRSARTTIRHCQQTLAGIGFTTEHDLHLFIRRALVLDGLLGTAATLTRDLGDELLATRALPPLLPL
jgi:hypothetical protein